MKSTPLLLATLFASLAFSACAEDTPQNDIYRGTVTQATANDLSSAVACGIDTPCTNGLDCLWIDTDNFSDAICISAEDACDAIHCGLGECLILESYPGQVACSGDDGGDNGGNETICNTPDGECPDDGDDDIPGCDDDEECTEPGHPGDDDGGSTDQSPGL